MAGLDMLSEHFSLREMTFSETAIRHGWPHSPHDQAVRNLKRLCRDVLEPMRDYFQCPIRITSGYRSQDVNAAIGGSVHSAHMMGCAADIQVPGWGLKEIYSWVAGANLPIDQQVFEFGQWIHVAIAAEGALPRYQCLQKRHGHPYEVFSVTDWGT